MDIVLGQHIITLAESEGPHNVVRKVREPSGHILIRATERIWVLDLLAKESNLVKDDWLIGAYGGFAHSMRDDPSFASMDHFIGGTGDILSTLLVNMEHDGSRLEYIPRVTVSLLVRAYSTLPEEFS